MAQRLLLPFRRSMLVCGYKTAQYRKSWGFDHYGIDLSTYQGAMQEDHSIRASGEGTVVAVGNDGSLGMGIAIVYPDCIGRDGAVKTLAARYVHMRTVYVTAGMKVSAGQIIAEEGSEGTKEPHLHFELDTDAKWPTYTPQVTATGHRFWRKGTDTTVNPSLWLWQKPLEATQEPYRFTNRAWITEGVDDNIPEVPGVRSAAELEEENAQLRRTLGRMRELIRQLSNL